MKTTKTAKRSRAKKLVMSAELAAYWAQSCSASVMADYASGNVKTIVAGSK